MMPVTLSVLSALLVAMLLWRVWRSAPDRDGELLREPSMDDDQSHCTGEFVAALFRRKDWEFVERLDYEPLKALFLAERKSLAEEWIRTTALSIRGIMRHHALASRRSRDLEIGTEFEIYSQYLALRANCGLLRLALRVCGPVRLERQSMRVYKLAERIREAHAAVEASAPIGKLQGI